MSITPKARDSSDLVRASSPDASVSSLRSVSRRLRRWKRWLNIHHPYNGNVLAALGDAHSIDTARLGEYIACSAPLHLADGWSYLSRAFDSASRGDRNAAHHLAYYAELRAAMSLLATEGMGVFLNWHVALNSKLEAKRLHIRNTHEAAWELLLAWSQEGRAENLLALISLDSKSLADWLLAIGARRPTRHVLATDWLSTWSIDLRLFSEDREWRNEMSYRPSRIKTPPPLAMDPQRELIEPLFNSWTALEPYKDKGSVALDVTLLAKSVELVTKRRRCNYTSFDKAVRFLKDQHDMSESLYNVLQNGQGSPIGTAIFGEAEKPVTQSRTATPVLARSLLMLRIASASNASLLARAQVAKADLEFWWSVLGSDVGLWDTPTDIDAFTDLWVDVVEAMDTAEDRISMVPSTGTVRSVGSTLSRDLALTQFSRAPLWLLGLD